MKFMVYDYDSPKSSDFLGECRISLGEIVGSRGQTCIKDLKPVIKKKKAKIIFRTENVIDNKKAYIMKWSCSGLRNVAGCCGANIPFLKFYRARRNDKLQVY